MHDDEDGKVDERPHDKLTKDDADFTHHDDAAQPQTKDSSADKS